MRTQVADIRAYWITNWAETTSTCFENEDFSPPDNLPWVRLNVRPASAKQVTIGEVQSLDRHAGIVHLMIFCPANTGEVQGWFLADKAISVFRKKQVNGITFSVPWSDVLGANNQGWWAIAITCPYWFEELT